MERRSFFKKSMIASAGAALFTGNQAFAGKMTRNSEKRAGENTFNLNYAPHFGMFRHHAGEDPIDQLKFIYDVGFRALEDNGMKGRSVDMQKKIAAQMEKSGMAMGVFVAHTIQWTEPGLTTGDPEILEEFLREVRESVEVARRVNAKWVTVVPGYVDLRQQMGYQTAHVVNALKKACDILEPHGLIMVLEPLNFRNHPGLFLKKIPQAYEICKAVDSPSCKILFDIYHQQIQEGNLIPNIDLAWEEIAYFQIGDNPGRKEPTTGEICYKNVFKHIYDKGYKDILGMEHGNSKPGKDGEKALIEAYRTVDRFET